MSWWCERCVELNHLHGWISIVLYHRPNDVRSLGFVIGVLCFVQPPLGINSKTTAVVIRQRIRQLLAGVLVI